MSRASRSVALTVAAFFPLWTSPIETGLGRALGAQGTDLARRIAAAPDGLVKMTFASRESICGDGRGFIADTGPRGNGYTVWTMDGTWISGGNLGDMQSRCGRGPVRLLLVVRDHRVVDVQPFVGPSTAATERPGTDLGTVATTDAARYLLDLATRGSDGIARNAILGASVADSVRIAGQLAGIARNTALGTSARESALKWVGRVADREGDREAPRVARVIAEDANDRLEIRERAVRVAAEAEDGPEYLRGLYPKVTEIALRERIVREVAENGTAADIAWVRGIALDRSERLGVRERAVRLVGEQSGSRELRELYDRLDEASLRERVVRVMGEVGDGESQRWLREIVERRGESQTLRDRAIRSLAEMGDVAYLRSAYRSIDDDGLRERVLRSVVEAGGSETMAWLREIARDGKESTSLRERAVRLLAESGAPTSELSSLYDGITDRSIRERIVSLLAERGDRASRDKLRAIATSDPDEDMRQRALRRLGER